MKKWIKLLDQLPPIGVQAWVKDITGAVCKDRLVRVIDNQERVWAKNHWQYVEWAKIEELPQGGKQ